MLRIACTFDRQTAAPEISYALRALLERAGAESVFDRRAMEACDAHLHYGTVPRATALPCLWIKSSEFFGTAYRTKQSLPATPLRRLSDLPVLFWSEDASPQIHRRARGLAINADLIASAFFLLSGYEELIVSERDEHGRFLCASSVVGRERLAITPLCDRYGRVLAELLGELTESRPQRPSWNTSGFALVLSHDVDSLRRPRRIRHHKHTEPEYRRAGTSLGPLLELEKSHGVRSTFFFLTCAEDPTRTRYDLHDPMALAAITAVRAHGDEVGLHGSYSVPDETGRIARERDALLTVVSHVEGFRQHFLRFPLGSARSIDRAGFGYDSSLGWPDQVGFRNGTAWPFHPFDFAERRSLAIVEIPLVVMDRTLAKHCAKDLPAATELIFAVLEEIKEAGGCAAVLWHHEFFDQRRHPGYDELYASILEWLDANGGEALTGGEAATRFRTANNATTRWDEDNAQTAT